MSHIRLEVDGAIVYDSQAVDPGPTPTPPPPPPPPPPQPVPVGEVDFPVAMPGKYVRLYMTAGNPATFSVEGGRRICGEVIQASMDTVDTVNVRLWFTDSNGAEIPGPTYEGLWISGVMPTPGFDAPPGVVYFHVLLKDKSGMVHVMVAPA